VSALFDRQGEDADAVMEVLMESLAVRVSV
jgi:hypothetical protein